MAASGSILKPLLIVLLAGGIFVAAHGPTRTKLVKKMPNFLTTPFDDDPSTTLPPDLVLGLTDVHDLYYRLQPLTANGTPLASSDLRGKIAMMLVWNTDCGASCLATMRSMERLAERYAEKGVVAVTINNDSISQGLDTPEVRKYVEANSVQLPVLAMDLSTGRQFWPTECINGLAKQPFHELLVYDRNGAVRFRANQNYLRPVVQELLNGGYENYKEEKVREGSNPPLVVKE